MNRVTTLLILATALTLTATGCVSRGRHEREVTSLQGQVAQMDQTVRAQEAELAHLKGSQQPGLSGTFQGAIYRTPGGFQLPALEIQKALKNAGYYAGTVDGKIGPGSREAIRSFQRDNGLTPDGVCGKQTWDKLKPHLNTAG